MTKLTSLLAKMMVGGEHMETGWKIKNMRKLLGISREQLAFECGVKKKNIKRLENGAMMSAELLRRVSIALGVSADYLLGLTD